MSMSILASIDFLLRTCFDSGSDPNEVMATKKNENQRHSFRSTLRTRDDLKYHLPVSSPTEKTESTVSLSTAVESNTGSCNSTSRKNHFASTEVDRISYRKLCGKRSVCQEDLLQREGIEIHGMLNSGRFGSSLLAKWHRSSNEMVCINTYHKSVLNETYQQHIPQRELSFLQSFDHPFISSVLGTFCDRNCLYMISSNEVGGPLSHLLRNSLSYGVTDKMKNFYVACVVSVLKYAHSKNIIHRGLHPDSLLIDGKGYLKVTDWGFAKQCVDRTFTLCGHVEYLCPEALFHDSGYGKGADYWALGVLIYEIFVGRSAFAPSSLDFKYDVSYDDRVRISTGTECTFNSSPSSATKAAQVNEVSLSGLDRSSSEKKLLTKGTTQEYCDASSHDAITIENILTREPIYPSYMPHPVKSIIQGLCQKNVTQRLGSRRGGKGIDEIQTHIFFQDIEWARLHKKLTLAPWIPSSTNEQLNRFIALNSQHYPNFKHKVDLGEDELRGPAFTGYNCREWNVFCG